MMSDVLKVEITKVPIIGIFDTNNDSDPMSRNLKLSNKRAPTENQELLKNLPIVFVSNIQSFGKNSKTDKTVETEVIL